MGGIDSVLGVAHGVVDVLDELLPPADGDDVEKRLPEDRRVQQHAPSQAPSQMPQARSLSGLSSAYAARAAAAGAGPRWREGNAHVHMSTAVPVRGPAHGPAHDHVRDADSTALAVRSARRFCVVPAMGDDGSQVWVVTDGVDTAVCSSADLAAKVRAALG